MTDEAPRKAWARCPACSTVYPNIQIAKDGHKLNCPHDMNLRIQDQDEKIVGLEKKLADLGGNLDEISSEPGIDFTGVEDEIDEEDESAPVYEDEVGQSALPVSDGWDDDDESLASVPIVR